ncbi:MAG: hypothetical protein M3Q69_11435 [Acidobacteriota bacterium]|nr:hypothetical protein [Acidobacteriota bacterium]
MQRFSFPLALSLVLSLFLSATATADLIVPQTASPRILIPVAGDAAGANGTYFRSDISIVNFRATDQRVLLRWYPQGRSGDDPSFSRVITVGARSGVSSLSFVANYLQQTGIGSIEIIGVTAEGNFDADAQLHATSRIWTPQPNVANGTMSQSFPAVVLTSSQNPVKWIFGVRRSDQFRLNVGVSNPSVITQRFRVTVVGETGAIGEVLEFDVNPLSMDQRGIPGTGGITQIIVQNISSPFSGTWQAWASSVDNVTGDATSQMAFPAPAVTPVP